MFTGLVEELAPVAEARLATSGGDQVLQLVVAAPLISQNVKSGDSIAVNGCCLTLVNRMGQQLTFQAGHETLSRTNLGRLKTGDQVNLERSLVLGDRLGGHLVTGHIDGQAVLVERRDEGDWSHLTFGAQRRHLRQIVEKGSVAVDGVSLTVVTADDDGFSVALIPYTLTHTTLGRLQVGDPANLETDLLAKYVERQLQSRGQPPEHEPTE